MKTCRLLVHGRVQGVGFRAYVVYKAGVHGVSGWVRNRSDGTVEAIVQGEDAAVEAMIAAAHRGPRASQVLKVEVGEAAGRFSGFEQRPTA